MKNLVIAGAVALAVSAVPVFTQTAQTPPPAGQKPADQKATTAKNPDERFVMDAAHANMAEVELGKLATDKASKDDVKKFGQRMVDDHSKAADELKSIAQTKNMTWPADLDAKHKSVHDRLTKLSGDAFDRAYMQEMVEGHRKVAAALRTESTSGKDPEIKAWAAKTMPTVQDHLKQAQDIARGVVGTTGTAKPKP
jgi:putative membrane protein